MFKGVVIDHNSNWTLDVAWLFGGIDIIHYNDFSIQKMKDYDYVILSGGPINISGDDDVKEEKEFIRSTDKPVLGICLGMQIICIAHGEKLFELKTPRVGMIEKLGKLKLRYEHGWYINHIPDDFDGIIEHSDKNDCDIVKYIKHKNKPIMAFQGHPEESWEYGDKIKKRFYWMVFRYKFKKFFKGID